MTPRGDHAIVAGRPRDTRQHGGRDENKPNVDDETGDSITD
jgi:hypothetical protein